jgi:hypothetical protein
MLGGVGVFDYDNDGWPDIQPTEICQDWKDRRFVGRLPYAVTGRWRDGQKPDWGLGIQQWRRPISITTAGSTSGRRLVGPPPRRNRGDGLSRRHDSLGTDAKPLGGGGGWFDYDSDGWLDLFVVHYVAWDPAAEPFCEDHHRQPHLYHRVSTRPVDVFRVLTCGCGLLRCPTSGDIGFKARD